MWYERELECKREPSSFCVANKRQLYYKVGNSSFEEQLLLSSSDLIG